MTFESVHNNRGVMLLQCVSGSRAYGLHTAQSDTDIRGVFAPPLSVFYGLGRPDQVADATNDRVYYELGRYIELLIRNNPNILELLNTPADCLLYRHPVMEMIKPEAFLSKLCLQSFAGYAQTQVKKAGGLNKKIFNPVGKERKNVTDFCYFISGGQSVPLTTWLQAMGYGADECGLAKINHAKDVYALFHQSKVPGAQLHGIVSGENANDIRLSSIPELSVPEGIMTFNKDAYSIYCKDYREYWEWVEKRNDVRYENTLQHGKNYDAKNMMHTFRLLHMAGEIARERRVNVRRHDRDFLLRVKNGDFTYEQLMEMVEAKMQDVTAAFSRSSLPDEPDGHAANELLVIIRTQLYSR
ncbi:MAG: nucleotidyltransferase domain-containing protein [Taibaiella sp.]|nr:nucleotidyltransferase domain-containing protein [Taibaiella sp.]